MYSKPSTRLVRSISSGLKKSSKIFKKSTNDESKSNDNVGKKRYSLMKRRGMQQSGISRQRRRIIRKRKEMGIIGESESLSSPERLSLLQHQPLSPWIDVDVNDEEAVGGTPSRSNAIYEYDPQSLVISNFEYFLRLLLSYFVIYLIGAYQLLTSWLPNAAISAILYCIFIMWSTCVIIKWMIHRANVQIEAKDVIGRASTSKSRISKELFFQDVGNVSGEIDESDNLIDSEQFSPTSYNAVDDYHVNHYISNIDSFATQEEETKYSLDHQKDVDEDLSLQSEVDDNLNDVKGFEHSWAHVEQLTRSDKPQNHPELEDLFVINKMTNERLYPNGEPIPIDNDMLSGEVLYMVRTTDADLKQTPAITGGNSQNDSTSNYFRGKKRRTEIQMQFKFKRPPQPHEPFFICLSIDRPIKFGLIQRAFIKALLSFIQQKHRLFSHQLSPDTNISEDDKQAGRYEQTRLSLPAEVCIDRIVITKPGDIPPKLGGEIYEDPTSIEKRKKGSGILFNNADTYTFSVYTAYIDCAKWKVVSIPAIRPFSLATANEAQPMNIKFYTLNSISDKHLNCDMNMALDLEISHRRMTSLGNGTKAWIEKRIERNNDTTTNNIINDVSNDEILSSDSEDELDTPGYYSDLELIDNLDEEKLFSGPNHTATKLQHDIHEIYKQHSIFDVPAWVEMFDHRKKSMQRVYVVRIRSDDTSCNGDNQKDKRMFESFIRLRTGKQLRELVSLGIKMDNSNEAQSLANELASLSQTKTKNKKNRDHQSAVTKAVKRTIRLKSQTRKSSLPIAGLLNPADQSCIILSRIFARLSTASKSNENICQSLFSQILPISDYDSWFLNGHTQERGVTLPITNNSHGEFVVGRCIWESYWREEICVISSNKIEFFKLFDTKNACCSAAFCDVLNVRLVESSGGKDPLPLPKLVIETHWQCHYLAFAEKATLDTFLSTLNSHVFSSSRSTDRISGEWQAHFWQGFVNSPSEKWAKITSGKKKFRRSVLNTRQMFFDNYGITESFNSIKDIGEFVCSLLQTALSFSLEQLETSPDKFMQFQADTSRLKNISLQLLDPSGKDSFCIYVNLYHCLLQHSLLLSSSPPTKRSIVQFMRTHCYEIGGDVFSLAELECCIIRGNMSKGSYVKPPFVREPKKSRHFIYALDTIEPMVNFILNTGDTSKPRGVPILSPATMEDQLRSISRKYLRNHCSFDKGKNTLILPKICEVYKHDLGNNPREICNYIWKHLDDESQNILSDLSDEQGNILIKYDLSPDRFYSFLQLLDESN